MVMDLIGALGQVKKGAVGKSAAKRGYASSMNLVNGDAAFDTAAELIALLGAAGTTRRIWEYTCPAQRLIRWGFGTPALAANQGYVFFAIAQAGTGISHGILTLGYENHGRRVFVPVEDIDDARTHTTTNTSIATLRLTDKNQMIALPEGGSGGINKSVGQDSRLTIDYAMLVAAAAADIADFNIPVTIYE